jgi:hypothetical protein
MVLPSKELTTVTKWWSIGEPQMSCDKLPHAQLSVLSLCPSGGVVLLLTRVPTRSPLLLLFGAPDFASFKTSQIMPTYLTP